MFGAYRLPANVCGVDINYAAPGDRGRRAVVHVVYLQQQTHGWGKGDALIAGQGQHPVVIHHRIHGLQADKLKVKLHSPSQNRLDSARNRVMQVNMILPNCHCIAAALPLTTLHNHMQKPPIERSDNFALSTSSSVAQLYI